MFLPSKKIAGLLIITALLFCATTSAFGLSYNTLYAEDGASNLYTVDANTGAVDLVGAISVSEITDIAFSGTALYGITWDSLYSIDPNTGAGSYIGEFGGGYIDMNSLVADENGVLYAADENGNFLTIDPASGAGTLKGQFGSLADGASGDLEFVNGTLYASVYKNSDSNQDYLATIDIATGVASEVWGLGYANVYGLGYKDDILYGVTNAGELLDIDIAKREVSLIGPANGTSGWGMSVSPVPEPATILLLCTGLGAAGLTRFRKRFKK